MTSKKLHISTAIKNSLCQYQHQISRKLVLVLAISILITDIIEKVVKMLYIHYLILFQEN